MGTSGGRFHPHGTFPRERFVAMAAMMGLLFANAVVSSLSVLDEYRSAGRVIAGWEPWVWELSSALSHSLLLPLVAVLLSRVPLSWPPTLSAVLVHALATLPFSFLHVGLMGAMRVAVYAAAGRVYDTAFGLSGFIYEYRKDVFTYAVMLAVLTIADAFARRRDKTSSAEAAADVPIRQRIEVRDGSRRLWVTVPDIFIVQAAGNYVELVTAEGTHLIRRTLSALAEDLAPFGFVRIHRSRLINPAAVRSITVTPSGDMTLTLTDGRIASGSRRYRQALEDALQDGRAHDIASHPASV